VLSCSTRRIIIFLSFPQGAQAALIISLDEISRRLAIGERANGGRERALLVPRLNPVTMARARNRPRVTVTCRRSRSLPRRDSELFSFAQLSQHSRGVRREHRRRTMSHLAKLNPARDSLSAKSNANRRFGGGKTWPHSRRTVKRRARGAEERQMRPSPRAETVDDVRGQFGNCASVGFAVGASDRKTRSRDTRARALRCVR